MTDYHVPVLLKESVDYMNIAPSGVYVDLTFGGGGHSREILRRMDRKSLLVGFDQDLDAIANVPDDKRFLFMRSNFCYMRSFLRCHNIPEVNAILADLGVSSHHFDSEDRGFSFRFDSDLDMRMNQHGATTACHILNKYTVEDLTAIFKEWGELPGSYRIAKAIEKYRGEKEIIKVSDLLDALKYVTPKGSGETKFLAKLFQAIRIEVNGEMEALKMMLEQSLKVLAPGGRLVVITYHSLEDRLVKNFMRSGTFSATQEKDFYGNTLTPFEIITRKAIVPDEKELEINPRSRSAKLRVAVKL